MQQRIESALKTLELVSVRAVRHHELLRKLWEESGYSKYGLEALGTVENQMTPEQKKRFQNLLQIESDFWSLRDRLHDGRARQKELREAFNAAEAAPLLVRKRLMNLIEAHWALLKDSELPIPASYKREMRAKISASRSELSEEARKAGEAIIAFARGKN